MVDKAQNWALIVVSTQTTYEDLDADTDLGHRYFMSQLMNIVTNEIKRPRPEHELAYLLGVNGSTVHMRPWQHGEATGNLHMYTR